MRIALALVTTCLLCACGQKGALYLPGEEREAVSTTTETAASPGTTEEERERAAAAGTPRTN